MKDRTKLPYRKNCEGYFFYKGKVLAQDTGKGYVLFPGGGIDEEESPEDAVLRETFEETGAVIKNLKKVGKICFEWGQDWAKTEKQKERYEIFRGEEMHLFSGEVEELQNAPGDITNDDPGWEGEVLTLIEEVVDMINSTNPFSEDMLEYRKAQLDSLKEQLGKIV